MFVVHDGTILQARQREVNEVKEIEGVEDVEARERLLHRPMQVYAGLNVGQGSGYY
jgi:tetrahydromethanopterin S-methyltransferase subunit F